MSRSTVEAQVVSSARDALSRAVRQTIQALIPTLLIVAGGSITGINIRAVAWLAGVTALVSVLSSVTGFTLTLAAPAWARIAERAVKAAAGTALGLLTVDGMVVGTSIAWGPLVTASAGSALLAVAMFYTNPPVVAVTEADPEPERDVFDDGTVVDATVIVPAPLADRRDSGYADVFGILIVLTFVGVLLLLLGISFR